MAQRLLIISDGLGLPSEAAQANNTPVIALQQSNPLIAKLCGRVYHSFELLPASVIVFFPL
jgi:hypothetical protein